MSDAFEVPGNGLYQFPHEQAVGKLLGLLGVEYQEPLEDCLSDLSTRDSEIALGYIASIAARLEALQKQSEPSRLGALTLANINPSSEARVGYVASRQTKMRENYKAFIEANDLESFMEPEMASLFTDDILKFLDRAPQDDCTLAGVLKGSPAFDNPHLGAWLGQAFGIGRQIAEGQPPLCSLTLVSDVSHLSKKIGQDLKGPAIVMAYEAFMRLPAADIESLKERVDLLFLSKAHLAASRHNSERIRNFMMNRMTLAATSLLGHYPAVRKLHRVLDIKSVITDASVTTDSAPKANPPDDTLNAGHRFYIAPDIDEQILPIDIDQEIPSRVPLSKICTGEYGGRVLQFRELYRIVDEIGATPEKQMQKNRGVNTISAEEYRRYLDHMDEKFPLFDPANDASLTKLCTELDLTPPELARIHPGRLQDYARYNKRRQPFACIDIETANWLRLAHAVTAVLKTRAELTLKGGGSYLESA